MDLITRFQLPHDLDSPAFLDLLESNFHLTDEDSRSEVRTYADTFDWRLYNQGYAVTFGDGVCTLLQWNTGAPVASFQRRKAPRFDKDLPKEAPWSDLAGAIEMRALLPLITLQVHETFYAVRNEDQKMVVRLTLRETCPENEADATRRDVILTPMRGYESEFAVLSGFLQLHGIQAKPGSGFRKMFRRAGLEPGNYSSKVNVQLTPNMRADEATRIIFQQLMGIMRQNMDGLREDLDIEFLHDFRVAVRRTRSALSQVKGIFDPEFTAQAKSDFGYVGRLTNFMRDADVYLLARESYLDMVPDVHKPGVDAFFKYLARRRVSERRRMLKEMAGERFTGVLDAWEGFLESPLPAPPTGPNGGRPIKALAAKFIRKRYSRVIEDGLAIEDSTPDEELHELRIDCKKLRYLLEFFLSLFPTDDMKRLIGNLKKLQENLGDFNDLCVQAETLQQYLQKPPAKEKAVHTAIGVLIGVLYARQLVVRRQFHEKFTAFAGEENRLLFQKLFGDGAKGTA